MKDYNNKVKFMYGLLAKIYDFMDIAAFPKEKFNPRFGLAKLIPNDEISILDVCFGTGNTSLAIAAKNSRNRITGIDLSEEMLKVANRKIKKAGLDNITVHCMDATKISLNEEFDVVTTSLSLHEMPGEIMDGVISEMSRLLKKQGKMYIIDWAKPESPLAAAIFMFFPYQFEPSGFSSFLKIDWGSYLSRFGLTLERAESYGLTKLMVISK